MGPRVRRRAAWLAAAVAVAGVAGVAIFFLAGPRSSTASQTTTAHPPPGEQGNAGIAYGDTPEQVLRRLGAPAEKQGGCWVYRAGDEIINGFDAVKFCFSAGPGPGTSVSDISDHYVAHTWHGTRYPAAWGGTLIFGCPIQTTRFGPMPVCPKK